LRSPEDYRAHLREAFARADIPVHFARGAVRPDPAGRAFVALLECAAEGLSALKFRSHVGVRVPSRRGSSSPAAPHRPRLHPPAKVGYTRSSMTAFG
jgi:hypothetical protein